MAQRTHEYDRARIMTSLPREVYDIVRARSAVLGVSMGQYVGNVLADHVGRNEVCDADSSLAEWLAALELAE